MQLNIIELARQADPDYGNADGLLSDSLCGRDAIERFAQLVAAAVKEECAKAIDARDTGDCTREDMEARRCAAAIRSMEVKT